ncbi:MAG: GNAT family N-acetyltransferase [Candidatus Levybacteria bacterium]|nr:GNAT family N-acetyltransferase [Candidatus Levybacteria bacterium]
MDNLIIQKLKNKDQMPWNLLLLADPSREKVEEYLRNSSVYGVILHNEVIGVYVLVNITSDVTELKNIAVDKKYQGQGIGKRLVLDAVNRAKTNKAKRIEVGTGNSSLLQLALYQKCGFKIIGIDKGFFIRNYEQEIVENGIKCVDMIRLAINF